MSRARTLTETAAAYEPVTPREHDPACRRGTNPIAPGRLDRERCERCRNLWARIDAATERRRAANPLNLPPLA